MRPAHLGLALLSLAMGGFAIGTTEFMSMGLLPDIARGIGESVPTTGHVITAYAFGVVVGAPLLVSLGARLPRRGLAVALVLALGIGNAMTAVASTYGPVMLARFVAGLPHGAYFGVASLIAASMVPPQHRGRAISSVCRSRPSPVSRRARGSGRTSGGAAPTGSSWRSRPSRP